MKKSPMICLLIGLLVAGPCFAVPSLLNYQGKLSDSTGKPVADGSHAVQFKLYTAQTGGFAFWTSASGSVTTANGLFATTIGPITVDNLAGKDDVWVETLVDGTALTPRTKLGVAPYALVAGSVPDLWTKFGNQLVARATALGINSSNPVSALEVCQTGSSWEAGYFTLNNSSNSSAALYSATNGSGPAIQSQTTGTGEGLRVAVNNPSSSAAGINVNHSGSGYAVQANANGTGSAGLFKIGSAANNSTALMASTVGSGNGLNVQVNNASNNASGIYVTYNGTGNAVLADSYGSGSAGYFKINISSNSNPALLASTCGKGPALRSSTTGTSDALYLQVDNNMNNSSGVYVTHNGSGNAVLADAYGTGRAGYFKINNASNISAALQAATNGAGPAFQANGTIAADLEGRVGIGTSNPSCALDVVGIVRSNGTQLSSDARYKTYVQTIADALDTVSRLRGVSFDWKINEFPAMSFAGGKQLGLIAQEVEQVLPQLVSMDSNGYRSVNYTGLVPVLIEAIKDQQAVISDQQNKVIALEKRVSEIDELKAELAALRKELQSH